MPPLFRDSMELTKQIQACWINRVWRATAFSTH
jgi:hypothetical protein